MFLWNLEHESEMARQQYIPSPNLQYSCMARYGLHDDVTKSLQVKFDDAGLSF